jgi:hypothetical protein
MSSYVSVLYLQKHITWGIFWLTYIKLKARDNQKGACAIVSLFTYDFLYQQFNKVIYQEAYMLNTADIEISILTIKVF